MCATTTPPHECRQASTDASKSDSIEEARQRGRVEPSCITRGQRHPAPKLRSCCRNLALILQGIGCSGLLSRILRLQATGCLGRATNTPGRPPTTAPATCHCSRARGLNVATRPGFTEGGISKSEGSGLRKLELCVEAFRFGARGGRFMSQVLGFQIPPHFVKLEPSSVNMTTMRGEHCIPGHSCSLALQSVSRTGPAGAFDLHDAGLQVLHFPEARWKFGLSWFSIAPTLWRFSELPLSHFCGQRVAFGLGPANSASDCGG